MPFQINIHEAKTHLSELLQRVMNGEEIIIAKAGNPIARLTRFEGNPQPRIPGNDVNLVSIAEDFNASLPEFEEL